MNRSKFSINIFLFILICLFISIAIIMQKKLNILSFTLSFYLIPSVLYSFFCALLVIKSIKRKILVYIFSSIIFSLFYTVICYTNIINFNVLLQNTNRQIQNNVTVSANFSSFINMFFMIFMLIIIIKHFFFKTLINEK